MHSQNSIMGVRFSNYQPKLFGKESVPKIRQWIEETMKTPPPIDKQPHIE